MMDNRYMVTSNLESGEGRYDICLSPKTEGLPDILIELKSTKCASEDKLKKLASAAIEPINHREYDTGLRAKYVKPVFKYGVAFCGKQVEIATE